MRLPMVGMLFWFFFGLAALGHGPLSSRRTPDLAEMEAKSIEQRQALKSGEVVWESELTQKGRRTRRRVATWFSGKRIRCDIEVLAREGKPAYREVTCVESEKPGYDLFFSDRRQPGGQIAVTFKPHKDDRSNLPGAIIDPRLLGYAASHSLAYRAFSVDACFCRNVRNAPTATSADLDGKAAVEVRFVNKYGAVVRYWLVPEWDYCMAKMVVENSNKGKKHEVAIVSHVERTSNAWYPTAVSFERKIDGVVEDKEAIKVVSAKFNEPVAEGVFSMAGMNIPDGQPVAGFNASKAQEWRDGKVVDVEWQAGITRYEDEPPGRGKYWAGLVGLGVGGIACAIYVMRRSKSNAP